MSDPIAANKFDCTVIIVSFNTKDLTDRCLTNVERAANYAHKILRNHIKIIVVDNASNDGTVAMIQKKYPSVILMAQKENLRFAKGNNLAFAKVKTPFLLMINSDTLIKQDTLVKILQHMKKNPTYDALCCNITFADGTFQRIGGYFPTPLRTAIWSFGLDSLPLLRNILQPIYNNNKRFYKHERQIDWCQGSFMLLRTEVYKKIGGFDEQFYFYMEDVDFCKRISDAGYKLYFTPKTSVIHLGGGSSKDLLQLDRLEQGVNGTLYFLSKYYPKQKTIIKHCMQLGMILRMFFYFFTGNRQYASTYRQLSKFIGEL